MCSERTLTARRADGWKDPASRSWERPDVGAISCVYGADFHRCPCRETRGATGGKPGRADHQIGARKFVVKIPSHLRSAPVLGPAPLCLDAPAPTMHNMKNFIPGLGLILVLVAVAVWWLVVKAKAGAAGVSAHRHLLATDRYYRMLCEQSEQDRRMGDSTSYSGARAPLYLLEHLRDSGVLSAEEFEQAAARVRAKHTR